MQFISQQIQVYSESYFLHRYVKCQYRWLQPKLIYTVIPTALLVTWSKGTSDQDSALKWQPIWSKRIYILGNHTLLVSIYLKSTSRQNLHFWGVRIELGLVRYYVRFLLLSVTFFSPVTPESPGLEGTHNKNLTKVLTVPHSTKMYFIGVCLHWRDFSQTVHQPG